jgi:glycerol-1-phosphate dehydrogenase [NAD(P)+]
MPLLPPKDWDIHFAAGVIKKHCGRIDDYTVLASPTAWRNVQPQLLHKPKDIAFVTSQEADYNESLVKQLPRTRFVLGIGGGMAVDAAKYVAWKHKAALITIPTIVSTGAIFQPSFPQRRQGRMNIIPDIKVPQQVLFDTDIIRQAPIYLNAAGMAECICWLARLASWRWWCDNNLPGPAWDQDAADEVENWVTDRVGQYTRDLDSDGRPGPDAIRVCAMLNTERFDLKIAKLKAGRSIDHLLDNTFTHTHQRSLLHGELVALGTLVNNVLHGSRFNQCRDMLSACHTRYRPDAIGCTWEQIYHTLQSIRENCDAIGQPPVWMHHCELTSDIFAKVVNQIDS